MITVNGVKITPNQFPDGTFCLHDVQFPSSYTHVIDWRWEDPSEYMLLYMLVNYMRDKVYVSRIKLIMPYIPDARMDRTKRFTEVFTLKYFAKFINDLGFDVVGVLDPHSNVSTALFNRVYEMDVMDFIADAIGTSGAPIVCFPDDGAMKRYHNPNMKKFVYGKKHRDWDTGEIKGLSIENPMNLDLTNQHIIIIDDICSKGGTFYYAGKALKELGAGQIDLYVTHCENTIFDGKLLDNPNSPITEVYTTDSLVRRSHPNIHVFQIKED